MPPTADGTPTEAEHLEGRYPDADLDGARTYYFGCLQGAYGETQAGHHLHGEPEPGQYPPHIPGWRDRRPLNHPWREGGLDGTLAPDKGRGVALGVGQPQGQAALHHKGGWTAIAFWDRTGDSRGNSNSVFLIDRELAFPEALALARERWPELFERFDFEVVPVEVTSPPGPDT